MPSERLTALQPVLDDLRQILGDRLTALVAYGWRTHGPVPSVALVASLGIDDLDACAARTAAWHRAGAATPLLLTPADFARSLDAFPIEYDEILASRTVVHGRDPFDGHAVARDDLRRACEVQVKSHLLHLREDYLESAGQHAAIAGLVRESAPGFAALLRHLARLDDTPSPTSRELAAYAAARIGLDGPLVGDLLALAEHDDAGAGVDAVKIFPAYLAAMERLSRFIDGWPRT